MLHAMLRAAAGSTALQALIDSLFGAGDQGAVYVPQPVVDGEQALFQDSAGTMPVTADGDPDGLMIDQSPNSNNASQPTTSDRPVYKTDGTLNRLYADGVNDLMNLPASLIPNGAALRLTSFAMSTTVAASPNKIIGFGTNATNQAWRIGTSSTGAIRVESQGQNIIGTISVTDGTAHVVTVYTTGSNLSTTVIRVDGVIDAISNPSSAVLNTDASGQAFLFAKEDTSEYFKGDLFSLVHVLPAAVVSASNIDDVESYLAYLAGVTL